ncbi:DNA polymerase IV-like protein ImuB [Burkholderia cenocepacia KC-01]|nr:DNA polymerase IV-like protein ImuB [Burkholderia cenocepacia KC-01]
MIAVRLKATRVESVAPPADDLFPEPGGTRETRERLFELLVARLGADNVLRAAPVADYRPEVANRWLPLDAQAGKPAAVSPAAPPRPAWLLAEPLPLLMRGERPVFHTPLRMMSSAERIEAGWFDGQLAARDYHVAQDEEGACYWVFKERTSSQAAPRWFLHGLFG